MKHYPLAIYSDHPELHFERRVAARLAKVSVTFIHECEREELITCRRMLHGRRGLCCSDVSKLKIVRHLYEDMGLDLEAVDFVLQYRSQIETMRGRLKEMEFRMQRKEAAYLEEIQALRRRLSRESGREP